MGEPVQGYFLYVNDQQVQKLFMTRDEAEEEAKPHLLSQAALRIQTTWGLVRAWNYRYDLKQWVELVKG
jgi:hypothetical protein